jgi:RNA polymerase sigma-70 factor (ECF subfamily)
MADASPQRSVPLILSGVTETPARARKDGVADPPRERLRVMFEAHYAQLHRVLRRLGLDGPLADDAAQEVFVVAARRLADIVPGAERHFLLGAARRVAAASRREAARWSAGDHQIEQLRHPSALPELVFTDGEERRMLDAILAQLDDDAREAFVLFEIEGISRSEVAALLGIPEGTAASRLKRARKLFLGAAQRLKARLSSEGGRP